MDLVQFFVTFFSCFLSLLLVAAVVWKIKQTCWASRRREQLMRERQQMASRPFASVAVALESVAVAPEVGAEQTELLPGPAEGAPKPIAMEPCSGGKAAVLTVLMCLPRGSSTVPPPGQSGIAIASALIDTSQHKPMDFKEKSSGLKNRKQLPAPHQGTISSVSSPPLLAPPHSHGPTVLLCDWLTAPVRNSASLPLALDSL
ncbi:hypothetical protein COCON_G00034510 [Conger conger]|uniref:Attractin n=1 Tax=Conger conger TaxID=82655 RepID=A0A9Q1DZH3_CONCO|nr:hypothetical protein COCON_G00034510 [Conger conger]